VASPRRGRAVTHCVRAGRGRRQDGGVAVLGGGGAAGFPEGAARALLPAVPPDPARAVLVAGDQQVAARPTPAAEGPTTTSRAGLRGGRAGSRSGWRSPGVRWPEGKAPSEPARQQPALRTGSWRRGRVGAGLSSPTSTGEGLPILL